MSIYSPDGFGMFDPSKSSGELTINSISMHTYGWNILDLRDLWVVAAVRGQDRLIPGVPGLRPKRHRRTATPHSLPMVISGMHTPDGVAVSGVENRMAQLQDNIDYLMANVVTEPGTMTGTRTAVLYTPSGGVRTGAIHVLSITPGQWSPATLRCTLDISIPGGMLQ